MIRMPLLNFGGINRWQGEIPIGEGSHQSQISTFNVCENDGGESGLLSAKSGLSQCLEPAHESAWYRTNIGPNPT
ncbi:hypothetical protein GPNADHDJ_01592 [Stenotrophomonas maltophilia]|uniref:Uncharacterized protein n=1 Tax=Stenotrophomonas maltophilia TaxID=40324 RepID=A0AAX1IBV6_STEMA|nr:hypothetical protein GPNADHDJ_01592 [Stenotrophomonas maltophilia]